MARSSEAAAYAFRTDEPLGRAIARVLDEQFDRLLGELDRFPAAPEQAAHDARRRIKETRALLRLARLHLGQHYDELSAVLRDTARLLANVRDVDAMRKTLRSLRSTLVSANGKPSYERARRSLARHARRSEGDETMSREVAAARERLESARMLVSSFTAGNAFSAIAGPLEKTYRESRVLFRALTEQSDPAEFHEWRKLVKTHWYHMQLLRNVAPDLMISYRELLGALSKLLGAHHDLEVLAAFLATRRIGGRDELASTIRSSSRAIAERALAAGGELYAEKPRAWLARMNRYWELSRVPSERPGVAHE